MGIGFGFGIRNRFDDRFLFRFRIRVKQGLTISGGFGPKGVAEEEVEGVCHGKEEGGKRDEEGNKGGRGLNIWGDWLCRPCQGEWRRGGKERKEGRGVMMKG